MSNRTDSETKDLLLEAAEITNEVAKTVGVDSFTHSETIAFLYQQVLGELRAEKNRSIYEQAGHYAEAQINVLVDKRFRELLQQRVIPIAKSETVAQVYQETKRHFWRK